MSGAIAAGLSYNWFLECLTLSKQQHDFTISYMFWFSTALTVICALIKVFSYLYYSGIKRSVTLSAYTSIPYITVSLVSVNKTNNQSTMTC